ncbi:Hypothetical predicted protein [Cloeon dipterum]|uniref:Aldehyde dehydrogenase domain-containing protein n=1 Tax=Cloeon dipterum TaxID=197152 RepID=A0A8S1DV71_9INSE|nr:Hypothetical predicted protein [Cloeon dipterum]
MPVNPSLVCKLLDSMENIDKIPLTPAEEKLKDLRKKVPSSFINGQWLNPEPLKTEPWIHQEKAVVDKIYWHNYESLGQWSNLAADARKNHLSKVAQVIKKRSAELSEFEVYAHNAPADLLLKEVIPFLSSYWQYYSGWAAMEDPQNRQFYATGMVLVDVRKSRFPLLEANLAAAPALAAGCVVTVIGHTRVESLLFLASIANFPAGVLNVVVTDSESNPPQDAFVGRPLVVFGPIQSMAEHTEFFNAECTFYFCGRSSMIVLDQSDVEGAARALLEETAKRANFSLWPATEVLVQEHLFQTFVSYFEKINPGTPVSSKKFPESALGKIKKFAKDEGVKLIECVEALVLVNSRYEELGVSKSVDAGLNVVSIMPIRSLNEAVSIVNSRPRIISASVWTQEGPLATRAASALKVPLVWVNHHGVISDPASGLGSTLYSGFGRWGGLNGLLNFKQWRPTVCDKGAHRLETKWSDVADPTLRSLGMLIDGKVVQAASTKVLISRNETPFATIAIPNSKEVGSAVSAALKAFPAWSALSQTARAEAVQNFAAALLKSEAAYAKLLTDFGVEGDSIAAREMKAATQVLSKWCGKATVGQVLDSSMNGKSWTRQVAIGVVGICGPIDSLSALISLIAPALLAGNCVIVGASPREVLVALHLAQVGAALPAGVLSVVGPESQAHLAAHPELGALWVGFREATRLLSKQPKKVWRVDWACLDVCPGEYIIHHCTNCRSVCYAD